MWASIKICIIFFHFFEVWSLIVLWLIHILKVCALMSSSINLVGNLAWLKSGNHACIKQAHYLPLEVFTLVSSHDYYSFTLIVKISTSVLSCISANVNVTNIYLRQLPRLHSLTRNWLKLTHSHLLFLIWSHFWAGDKKLRSLLVKYPWSHLKTTKV